MDKNKGQIQAVVEVHPEEVVSTGPENRLLTKAEFQGLAQVPPELEWFANIQNERTRRAYQNDLHDFMAFVSIEDLSGSLASGLASTAWGHMPLSQQNQLPDNGGWADLQATEVDAIRCAIA